MLLIVDLLASQIASELWNTNFGGAILLDESNYVEFHGKISQKLLLSLFSIQ